MINILLLTEMNWFLLSRSLALKKKKKIKIIFYFFPHFRGNKNMKHQKESRLKL